MTADATYYRSQAAKARRDAEYQRKRAERLGRECRDLRDLCADMLDCLLPDACSEERCEYGGDYRTCGNHACRNYSFVTVAESLGVDVGVLS